MRYERRSTDRLNRQEVGGEARLFRCRRFDPPPPRTTSLPRAPELPPPRTDQFPHRSPRSLPSRPGCPAARPAAVEPPRRLGHLVSPPLELADARLVGLGGLLGLVRGLEVERGGEEGEVREVGCDGGRDGGVKRGGGGGRGSRGRRGRGPFLHERRRRCACRVARIICGRSRDRALWRWRRRRLLPAQVPPPPLRPLPQQLLCLSLPNLNLPHLPRIINRLASPPKPIKRPPPELALPERLDEPPPCEVDVGGAAAADGRETAREGREEGVGVGEGGRGREGETLEEVGCGACACVSQQRVRCGRAGLRKGSHATHSHASRRRASRPVSSTATASTRRGPPSRTDSP